MSKEQEMTVYDWNPVGGMLALYWLAQLVISTLTFN